MATLKYKMIKENGMFSIKQVRFNKTGLPYSYFDVDLNFETEEELFEELVLINKAKESGYLIIEEITGILHYKEGENEDFKAFGYPDNFF